MLHTYPRMTNKFSDKFVVPVYLGRFGHWLAARQPEIRSIAHHPIHLYNPQHSPANIFQGV